MNRPEEEAGGNMKLAQEVERVFTARGWQSNEQASIAIRMPEGTIRRLRKGIPSVQPDTARKFARKIGEDPEEWAEFVTKGNALLDAARGEEESQQIKPHQANRGDSPTSGEIQYLPDGDSIPLPEGYYGLDTAGRAVYRGAASKMLETLLVAMRASRQLSPGTHGFGVDRYAVANNPEVENADDGNDSGEPDSG